jgi:hypothetical protein
VGQGESVVTGIDDEETLTGFDLLVAVKAAQLPFSVVLTD